MPLNWSNDSLLFDKEPIAYNKWLTANDLLRTSTNGVLSNTDLSFENIYGIMVRKIDFVRKGPRDRIIARFPFLVVNEEIGAAIREKILLISELARDYFYRSINKSITEWRDVIAGYLEKGALPYPLFRCALEIVSELSLPVNINGNIPFMSARGERFTFPTKMSNQLAYLCGICNGDGNLRDYWIIVADETKEHIEFVTELLHGLFAKNGALMKSGGAWIVKLNLLWAVRLFNFLTNQAIDEPKYDSLREPLLFQQLGEPYRSLYWRGAFDADGSFKNQIVFCSISEDYSRDFQNYLIANDIESHFFPKKGGGYQVNVLAKDKYKFANLVGSLHPKKSQDYLKLLQKNIQNHSFIGFDEEKLTSNGYFDFTYLPSISILGLTHYLQTISSKTSIFTNRRLKEYKRSNKITIRQLQKHLTNVNRDLMSFIEENYQLVTFQSYTSQPLKLPIKPSMELEELASYLIPTERGATLYQTNSNLIQLRLKLLGIESEEQNQTNKLLRNFLQKFCLYEKFQVNTDEYLANWKEKIRKKWEIIKAV